MAQRTAVSIRADHPERGGDRRSPGLSARHAGLALFAALRPARADRAPGRVGRPGQLPGDPRRSTLSPGHLPVSGLHLHMRRPDHPFEHAHRLALAQGPARGQRGRHERARVCLGDARDRDCGHLAVDVRLRVRSHQLPAHPAPSGELHPPQLVRQPGAGARRAGPRRGVGSHPVRHHHRVRRPAPGAR